MPPFIGIDPGLKGYLAVLYNGGEEYALTPLPYEGSVLQAGAWLGNSFLLPEDGVITLEKQFTKGKGMNTILENYGALKAMLRAAGRDYDEVTPRTWKKYFGLEKQEGESDAAFKRRSVTLVEELFGITGITHDAAEAILIAEYGRRRWEDRNT